MQFDRTRHPLSRVAKGALALEAVLGIGALAGGLTLMLAPRDPDDLGGAAWVAGGTSLVLFALRPSSRCCRSSSSMTKSHSSRPPASVAWPSSDEALGLPG